MAISRFRAPIILLLLLVASPAILLAQADVSDVPVPTLTRYATDLTVTLTASQVQIGLAVTAGNDALCGTARFDRVTVIP